MIRHSIIAMATLLAGLPLVAHAQSGSGSPKVSQEEFYNEFFRLAKETTPSDPEPTDQGLFDVTSVAPELSGTDTTSDVGVLPPTLGDALSREASESPVEVPRQLHRHSGDCSNERCGSVLGCTTRGRRVGRDRLGIDLGGWLAGGNTINSHGLRTPNGNAPMGFNNDAQGWVVNQAWLWVERAAETGGCGFDWGFRVDAMFGVDGPDTQAFGDGGWDASWDTSSQYGFAMPQLYGEVMFNETKVKIGHFYTIIGYEVVQAPENFFYSHALTRYYNEPFTHTGFLAERPVGERMTWYAGWTMGWDSGFDNRHDGSTFLGGIRTDITDDFTLTWAMTFGDRGFDATTYMQSLVADATLSDSTRYIFQTDWQTNDFGAGYEDAYGVNQYLLHTINDCWAAGTRLEWLRDDAGTYVGNGPGNYWDWTVGLNHTGWHGIVNRLEIRYDWFDGVGRPYARNTKRSQFTVGTSTYIAF